MTEFSELFEKIKDKYSKRERDVLRLRFGLDDGRIRTLEEVGQLFGVERAEIKKIELSILSKIFSECNITSEEFLAMLDRHREDTINMSNEKLLQLREQSRKKSEKLQKIEQEIENLFEEP